LLITKGLSQHAARQDLEQQITVTASPGISNDIAVLQPGSSSARNSGMEERAYINQAMEE
jgi:hypothetical protein